MTPRRGNLARRTAAAPLLPLLLLIAAHIPHGFALSGLR